MVFVPMTNSQGYYNDEREETKFVEPTDPVLNLYQKNNPRFRIDKSKKNQLILDPNRDFPYHL